MASSSASGWTPLTYTDAVGAGWQAADDATGAATRAFDEWLLTNRYQKAHLHHALRLAADRYEAAHVAVRDSRGSAEPGYPFADEVAAAELVDLWPADYEWFTLAAIVKDAVTAYEVYVRNASAEVLAFHGLRWRELEKATGWVQLNQFCRAIGLDPRPPELGEVFALRHVLTHSGGELRTAADRNLSAGLAASPGIGDRVSLSSTKVEEHLYVLDTTVRQLDPVLWAYSWGGYRVPDA